MSKAKEYEEITGLNQAPSYDVNTSMPASSHTTLAATPTQSLSPLLPPYEDPEKLSYDQQLPTSNVSTSQQPYYIPPHYQQYPGENYLTEMVQGTGPENMHITVVERADLEVSTSPTNKDIGGMVFAIIACLIFFWPLAIASIVLSGLALSYRKRPELRHKANTYTSYSIRISFLSTIIGAIILTVFFIVILL
ncbi:uncharacterized protein [Ptychodera flava]|uniref:uncharacterized protein n=1 Tax=Ptychodera flava TaxID=63121 RepID=UPI00396A6B94